MIFPESINQLFKGTLQHMTFRKMKKSEYQKTYKELYKDKAKHMSLPNKNWIRAWQLHQVINQCIDHWNICKKILKENR